MFVNGAYYLDRPWLEPCAWDDSNLSKPIVFKPFMASLATHADPWPPTPITATS